MVNMECILANDILNFTLFQEFILIVSCVFNIPVKCLYFMLIRIAFSHYNFQLSFLIFKMNTLLK